MQNEWIENTGTVPESVGPDTMIEVEYRDGAIVTWGKYSPVAPNDPEPWTIDADNQHELDVIRWRFLK